jgi:hypothetical protein
MAAPAGGDERLEIADPAVARLLELAQEHGKELRWVVVDDMDEDDVELAIGPWPSLREDGRVWFGRSEEDYVIAEVPRAGLHAAITAARGRQFPGAPEVVDRPLRVGDAFAALVEAGRVPAKDAPPGGHRWPIDLGAPDELADVTLAARELAKIQVAVAEATPIDADLLPDLRGEV